MRKINIFCTLIALLTNLSVFAQTPAPAPVQKGSILILGATAHCGDGRVIESSAIAIEAGKITMVADVKVISIDRSKYTRIFDANEKHVYPGLIGTNTTLGIKEIDAVRATNDTREVGEMNPSVRSVVAYNTDSDLIPTVRSNGVLMVQIVPRGGRISGRSSVVHLDGWNWEDATVIPDEGVHINWPEISYAPRRDRNEDEEGQKNAGVDQYKKSIAELEQFFGEAKAYCAIKNHPEKQIKFEAMRRLFDRSASLYVHADQAQAMRDALLFTERFGCRLVLVGAEESYLIADQIAAQKASVILAPTQRLPSSDDEDYDQPYKTPATLQAAGVVFAISDVEAWRQRNLPFQAGQAAGFGLSKEDALKAVSLSAAQILGIGDRAGSLTEGKDATLIISEGDVLDMRTSKVIAAFIQGREINLDDKHKALYRRFKTKYD